MKRWVLVCLIVLFAAVQGCEYLEFLNPFASAPKWSMEPEVKVVHPKGGVPYLLVKAVYDFSKEKFVGVEKAREIAKKRAYEALLRKLTEILKPQGVPEERIREYVESLIPEVKSHVKVGAIATYRVYGTDIIAFFGPSVKLSEATGSR